MPKYNTPPLGVSETPEDRMHGYRATPRGRHDGMYVTGPTFTNAAEAQAWIDQFVREPTHLAAVKRDRKATADGRCACGNFPALCSPMGRPCCFRGDE